MNLSPDGRTVALVPIPDNDQADNGVVHPELVLWDPAAETVLNLAGTGVRDPEYAFSPDSRLIAVWRGPQEYDLSASYDVKLFETTTGHQVGDAYIGHTGYVTGASFDPGRRQLATSSYDGTVRFWKLPS